MPTLGEWLGNTDFQPTQENAPETVNIAELLLLQIRDLIDWSIEHGREAGAPIGATDDDPVSFRLGPVSYGTEAHTSIALNRAPESPVGTFHTHPALGGNPVGGPSDADLAFLFVNGNCIFMIVTEIVRDSVPLPSIRHHLIVKGTGAVAPDDLPGMYRNTFSRKVTKVTAQRDAEMLRHLGSVTLDDGQRGSFRPPLTDGMLLAAQARALKSIAKRQGLIYYVGSPGNSVLTRVR